MLIRLIALVSAVAAASLMLGGIFGAEAVAATGRPVGDRYAYVILSGAALMAAALTLNLFAPAKAR